MFISKIKHNLEVSRHQRYYEELLTKFRDLHRTVINLKHLPSLRETSIPTAQDRAQVKKFIEYYINEIEDQFRQDLGKTCASLMIDGKMGTDSFSEHNKGTASFLRSELTRIYKSKGYEVKEELKRKPFIRGLVKFLCIEVEPNQN